MFALGSYNFNSMVSNGVRVIHVISYNLLSNQLLVLRDILVREMEACGNLDAIVLARCNDTIWGLQFNPGSQWKHDHTFPKDLFCKLHDPLLQCFNRKPNQF